ncbi:MAG: ABC transporter substrate-binding protein [Gammaproteobacteria bacterium]|nr:ABC transporter substrate-binding protein [Gammaproteobacteria bacterium]
MKFGAMNMEPGRMLRRKRAPMANLMRCLYLGAALSIGVVANEATVADDDTITIVSWGGPYVVSQDKAYFEPFTRKTGVNINLAKYDGGIEDLRAMVRAGELMWDLIDLTVADTLLACEEGLLEVIDHSRLPPAPDGTPAQDDFYEGALTRCGVAEIVSSTVLAFNAKVFPGEQPSKIQDLFDLEKFPGKRALQKKPIANLEWALMSYGVPREELYDLLSTERGLRLAFARLDQIKDHIVWWLDLSVPVKLLSREEVVIASGYNGRFFNAAVVLGRPIEIIWDGQLYELSGWGIPKGTPNYETVMEFISFATDTRRLADQAKYIPYGPARRSSEKLVRTHEQTGVDMRPHMPTAPANFMTAIAKDNLWYARINDRLTERFNAWLGE